MSNASSPNGVRNITISGNGKYTEGTDSSTQTMNFGPVNHVNGPNNGDTTSGTSQNHQSAHHTSRASENM